jgi:hypothetical protein
LVELTLPAAIDTIGEGAFQVEAIVSSSLRN